MLTYFEQIGATLPARNFSPEDVKDQLTLPLPREEQDMLVSLQRPGAVEAEPVDIGAIGADERGVGPRLRRKRIARQQTERRYTEISGSAQQR